jgi:hypothetical protein
LAYNAANPVSGTVAPHVTSASVQTVDGTIVVGVQATAFFGYLGTITFTRISGGSASLGSKQLNIGIGINL